MKTRREFLLGGSAYALVLAGCDDGGSAKKTAASDANVLNHGNGAEPMSLDPHHASGTWEDTIISDLMMGLMTDDAEANPIPGAAERWETSQDGKTWTFYLRDHQWSDGTPVTAEDFVYAWRRILDPKTAAGYGYFLYPIKNAEAVNNGKMPLTDLGVTARDDKTLVVELENPLPFMLQFLKHMTLFPVQRKAVEAKGDSWTQPGSYVGNGPYVLTEWVPNDHITLVKNPKFYDAANVKIDTVIHYPTVDYEAALRRFRAGELDVQDRLPGRKIEWIRSNIPETLKADPMLVTELLVTNIERKPFDDLRVRQALSLAIDRETIVHKISKVGGPAAYGLIPPGTANYPGDVYLEYRDLPLPDRIKQAQDLMRQAGYGPDKLLRTSILIRSASPTARRLPAVLQQMWTQIYVDAQILQLDASLFYDRIQTGDYDIANPGWHADFNDASNFLDLLRAGNPNNWGRYNNPEFDKLLNEAGLEQDLQKRGALLSRAEATALHDHAWIPLTFELSGDLVRPYVKGWASNITDVHRTRWMSLEGKARLVS